MASKNKSYSKRRGGKNGRFLEDQMCSLRERLQATQARAKGMEQRYSSLKASFEAELAQRLSRLESRNNSLSQRNSILEARVQKMEALFLRAKKVLRENKDYRKRAEVQPSVVPVVPVERDPLMADRMAAIRSDSILGNHFEREGEVPHVEGNF